LQLQKHIDEKLQTLGPRAGNAQKVVSHLYKRPLTSAEKVELVADVSMPTAYKLIRTLEEMGILDEVRGAERNRLYIFRDYVNLFRYDGRWPN